MSDATWRVSCPPRRGHGPHDVQWSDVTAFRSAVILDNVLAFYDESGNVVESFNKERWDKVTIISTGADA